MSFLAVRFDTDDDAADAWSDALLEAGALSVDLSDPRAGSMQEAPIYGEPGTPVAASWPVARIEALFDESSDPLAMLRAAAGSLARPLPPFETARVADEDWVRITQAQFAPMQVAPGLWIVPSWCEPPHRDAMNIRLDPGLAFGTGSHPTTRLCLEWLAAHRGRAQSVLDYGCGSGILAIAAAKLGARRAVGVDVDPQALAASRDNAKANGVDAQFVLPEALVEGTFDAVVANILANPLILLAPALAARTRPGGRIALSGILEAQAGAVSAAYAPWFKLAAWRRDDGWVLLEGVRDAMHARA